MFPLVATIFIFVAFYVIDVVVIKIGLNGIFKWSMTAVAVVISVAAVLLAIYGHDWLHKVFSTHLWASVPFWVILTIGIMSGNAGGTAVDKGIFSFAGFR